MGQAAGDATQRSVDAGQAGGATRAQDVAQQASRVKRWRHLRPRGKMGLIGGAAASAAVVVAGVALATRDEPATERPAAVETTVETASTDAPITTVAVTQAPAVTAAPTTAAPTTAAPTTVAETTTTVEATTTVPALPSGAGTYAVTGGDIVISGSLVNTVIGTADPETWMFTGACDGVGECSIAADGTSVATTAGASPLPAGGTIELAPAGPGVYVVTSTIPISGCGDGVGSMTIALADGTLSGDWVVTFAGADCPFTTLATTYNGVRT